jgi:hypothetical protein
LRNNFFSMYPNLFLKKKPNVCGMLTFLFGLCLFSAQAINCAPGYKCFEENPSKIWVLKVDGNVNGPTCSDVCSVALCPSGTFHVCDAVSVPVRSEWDLITRGLGFSCTQGGCWGSNSGVQSMWVSIAGTTSKTCYFPANTTSKMDCNIQPGNANCFSERYSLLCPCKPSSLESACRWPSDIYTPSLAVWPTNSESKSCLDRINYWRKKACAENWIECANVPCGLPPMVEGVACRACANSEADYDEVHGAHASFTRCSENSQGEGGGATCANLIDAFVSERAPDSSGVVRCTGHCGPIVEPGCRAFFYGKTVNNFYTMNWSPCNKAKCDAYCNDPAKTSSGGVCRVDASQAPTLQAPTPQSPSPKAPTLQVPTPQVPTPKVPTAQVPTAQVPTLQAPTPARPTSQAPTTYRPSRIRPTRRPHRHQHPTRNHFKTFVTDYDYDYKTES